VRLKSENAFEGKRPLFEDGHREFVVGFRSDGLMALNAKQRRAPVTVATVSGESRTQQVGVLRGAFRMRPQPRKCRWRSASPVRAVPHAEPVVWKESGGDTASSHVRADAPNTAVGRLISLGRCTGTES